MSDIALLTDDEGQFSLSIPNNETQIKLGIYTDDYKPEIISIACKNDLSLRVDIALTRK